MCPFCQRVSIALAEKNIDHVTTIISASDKPNWFRTKSPLGTVPLLVVDDTVLFESMAVVAYLDDYSSPLMMPADPISRAIERAWTPSAGVLLSGERHLVQAVTSDEFDHYRDKLKAFIEQMEKHLGTGPYFNGEQFSHIDIAYAPAFLRLDEINKKLPLRLFEKAPNFKIWFEAVLARPSVQKGIEANFAELYSLQVQDHYGTIFQQQ